MCKNCETRPKLDGAKLATDKVTVGKPSRPTCLELVDAKAEIFKTINDVSKKRQIPFWLLESIILDAARQVSELAAKERENAKQAYEKQLEEGWWET